MADTQRFLQLFDATRSMPDDQHQDLIEEHGGELGYVSTLWQACKDNPDDREYDPCDAGYIFLALVSLQQTETNLAVRPEDQSKLWHKALVTAEALTALVDFGGGYDFGIFCYEQIDTETDGLVYRVYHETCGEQSANPFDVVQRFAESENWPLLNAPA
jgi:hypothetical protein